ncbi:MAG: hypothetical protein NVS1B11_17110 [Terriglobales bacterium]
MAFARRAYDFLMSEILTEHPGNGTSDFWPDYAVGFLSTREQEDDEDEDDDDNPQEHGGDDEEEGYSE